MNVVVKSSLIAVLLAGLVLMVDAPFIGGNQPYAGEPEEKCLVDQAALEDIKVQNLEIRKKKQELKEKEAELSIREKAVEEEIGKLKELKKEVSGLQSEKDQETEAKIGRVVETFEKMSPKTGAKLLGKLSDSLAVAAMERISTQKLAKIINSMEPDRSSYLTELMATGKKRKQSKKGGE